MRTRRALLGSASATSAVFALAACGVGGAQPGGETKSQTPKEMSIVKTVSTDQVDNGWRSALEAASKATNVKATLITEAGGAPFWDKRQAEYAGGSAGGDVTYN